MSIQWTFIAGFLYFEVGVVIIMMLPIFSPRRWHQFFKSRLFTIFQQRTAVYFYVLLGVLCLFLLDAIREMKKYSHGTEGSGSHIHLANEMKGSVKLFRAQRNFYITGFSIFLAFVIRRLGNMLIIQDELSIKAEKIIKEAEATVKLAKDAVLINTIESNDAKNVIESHKQTEALLEEEQQKVKNLEEEVNKWKTKYMEAVANSGDRKEEEVKKWKTEYMEAVADSGDTKGDE